jgi:hypothetical protein
MTHKKTCSDKETGFLKTKPNWQNFNTIENENEKQEILWKSNVLRF